MTSIWKTGYWVDKDRPAFYWYMTENTVKSDNLTMLEHADLAMSKNEPAEIGHFGPARKEVAVVSGQEDYNIRLFGKVEGVLSSDGSRMYFWGDNQKVATQEWISQDQLKSIMDDRDHIDTPSCPQYTLTPDKPGRIIWISGPPGAGKSTTCQLLAREKGYVYLELDAVVSLINPFPDINAENPTLAGFRGKAVKGVSRDDVQGIMEMHKVFHKLLTSGNMAAVMNENGVQGKYQSWRQVLKYFKRLLSKLKFNDNLLVEKCLEIGCKQILTQKKRLGGDFAVARATPTRQQRTMLKKMLGEDLVFIVLNLDSECQEERLRARHSRAHEKGIVDMLKNMHSFYEPAGDDEKNAFNVTISRDMSSNDVLGKVIDVINELETI